MPTPKNRSKQIWQGETQPKHSIDDDAFFEIYSKELKVFLGDCSNLKILEIGCGTGALYEHLGFDKAKKYIGTDVSSSMIAEFKVNYPEANVRVSDGESILEDEKFDLIFSNGVVQYFTKSMMREHLDKSNNMLNSGGRVIDAMIPWRAARHAYCDGSLKGHKNAGPLQYLKSRIAQKKHGFMGRWYDHRELNKLANDFNFDLKLYGSLHYNYRLHAVFTKSE